jgi:glycyl-tRNA synthetase beta chain
MTRSVPMSLPFLLEIGTEEIPDWMIPARAGEPALLFEKLEIPHDSVTLDATPRRLVLRAEGLPARQADSEERVLGPAKSAPPQAVAGLRAQAGRSARSAHGGTTPKGEYYTFVRTVAGRPPRYSGRSAPGIILQIGFPKTMYWTGKGGPRFIRPIRWIVALLGEEIVPFESPACIPARSLQRPSPAGRARDRRHHRRLRERCARIT